MVQSVQRRKEAENKNKEMFFSTAQGNHRPRQGSRLTTHSRAKRKLSGLRSNSKSRMGKRGSGNGKKGGNRTGDGIGVLARNNTGAFVGARSKPNSQKNNMGDRIMKGNPQEKSGQKGEPSESGFEYDYVRTVGNSSR